jgi:hypothetical protein
MSDTGVVDRVPSARGGVRLRESVREVVVVSLGILVAFGIDAWWGGTQDRREAESLFTAVVDELRLNAERLDRTVPGHDQVTQAGFSLLGVTGLGVEAAAGVDVEGIFGSFYMFWGAPRTELDASALTAVLESGALGQISDQNLRDRLGELPRTYSNLDAIETRRNDLMNQYVLPRLWLHIPQMNLEITGAPNSSGPRYEEFRASVPERSRFPVDLTGLLGDLVFENAVVERTTVSMIVSESSRLLSEDLRALAAELSAR